MLEIEVPQAGPATDAFREQVEIIQSGDLGEVRDVYVWNTNAGVGNVPLPTDGMPVPETLKWDLWLGPRKSRPYHSRWMKWHTLREFGTQQLGNWAIHTANTQFMGLRLNSLWYADPKEGPTVPSKNLIRVSWQGFGSIAARYPEQVEYPLYQLASSREWVSLER